MTQEAFTATVHEPVLRRAASLVSAYLLPSFTWFALGSVLHILAYKNIAPVVVSGIFYLSGVAVLRVFRAGGGSERKAFRLIFSICWFWAGVAAIYANFLDDAGQNTSDAAGFYALASGEGSGLDLEQIEQLTVGAGAVVLWRAVYDLFAAIGFEKTRYIGIAVNVLLVAMSGVIGVKMTKLTFGHDNPRVNRFILLFSLCGIFWLFASLHLRDAAVLFTFSALAFYWLKYMAVPRAVNLGWLVGANIGAFVVFGYLRYDFLLVPLATIAAGLAAIALDSSSKGTRRRWALVTAGLMSVALALLLVFLPSDLFDVLLHAKETYAEFSVESQDANSLGNQIIVNAPLLTRLVLGSAYLLIFPIPVWSGFQLDSAYQLLKSLNALFMYGLIPLLALAIWRIATRKAFRTASLLHLLFLAVGFTLAIAGTSLETRHLGVFLMPVLVLAALPDLSSRSERVTYQCLLVCFVASMVLIHFAWAILKFL